MLDLNNLPKEIGSHSYWQDRKNKEIKDVREAIYNKAQNFGVNLHQTEWCALNGNDKEGDVDGIPPYSTATPMDIALYLSKIIYADLKYAQVISWSYWTALGVERYSQKNRFYLIRLHPDGGDYAQVYGNNGTATADKNLWVLGNYSRFIRPGYLRVGLDGIQGTDGSEMNDLMGTAYLAPDNSKLVIVLNNLAYTAKPMNFNLPRAIENKFLISGKSYLTNSIYNLTNMGNVNTEQYTVPARSVVTFVFEYGEQQTAVDRADVSKEYCYVVNKNVILKNASPGSKVVLYDMDGKKVYSTVSCADITNIPFSLHAGILKVSTGKKQKVFKVIR